MPTPSKSFRDTQRDQYRQRLLNRNKKPSPSPQNATHSPSSLSSPSSPPSVNSHVVPTRENSHVATGVSNLNKTVAIIIAGRNSEKFLGEAIVSALNQTIPCEVVYSDDCSTDQSVVIAQAYISRGLRVISHGIHSGVCATRNRGALATKTPYLIFMDSDDLLPTNYVADMLADLQPGTPFIYPNTHPVGETLEMVQAGVAPGTFWKNRPWSQYDMWVQNQVSTTAMWSRSAFLAAGMWDGNVPTMWDYDLAIKCSRYGLPLAGRAVLDYRIHDNSVSAQLNERSPESAVPYQLMIRRRNSSLGIGCLCSGRCPELFPLWLDKLALSVKYHNRSAHTHNGVYPKPKLFLLLHNEAQQFLRQWTALTHRYSDTFHSVEFGFITSTISELLDLQRKPNPKPSTEINIRHPYLSRVAGSPGPGAYSPMTSEAELEKSRRVAVSSLMARGCQTIQDQLKTDLVWLVEDDIVVPMQACETLFNYVTSGRVPPIGVSGRYYSRHPGCINQIGGWIKDGKHEEPIPAFRTADPVDFVGTGCLMFWPSRPSSPRGWKPFTTINEPGATAHDWAWSEDVISKGGELLALGCVDCHHHIDLTEFV